MIVNIDSKSNVPIFQQVVDQITRAVLAHRLAPGDRLPSIRELSVAARLNPNTVARAYQELERNGITETRRGQGCFIASGQAGLLATERWKLARAALQQPLDAARDLGLTRSELEQLLTEALDLIYAKQGGGK